jgi:hypothetical protein
LENLISVKKCSYTKLDTLTESGFDYIFSNFGGLNCIPDLKEVFKSFSGLLKKNAIVTLVIMPPACPWEWIDLFKGRVKYAFRRFSRNGTRAQLEGEKFLTWYFSPSKVKRDLGKDYKLLKLEGLGSIIPPPSYSGFPARYPLLFKTLLWFDIRLKDFYPFNRWADHYIISFQFSPAS